MYNERKTQGPKDWKDPRAETFSVDPELSELSPSSHFVRFPSLTAPRLCSLLAALAALLVLAGWSSHVYALVTVLPTLPAMAQSTATAFLLASTSLWLMGSTAPDGRIVRMGRAVGVCTLLVGLATLLRYGLLLVEHGGVSLSSTGHPINHMSPNSALNFVLLGTALTMIDARGRSDRWPAQALALIVALDALVALVGQLYGITFLYGLSPYLGMALHTAFLFLVLSIGLLLARPDRGFVAVVLADDAAGRAARRFLPLALIAPVVLGGVSLLSQRLHRPDAPFLAYLLVVASVGLFGWLVWGNVLALSAQVHRSQSYERQVADMERGRVEDALVASEQRLLFAVEGAGIGTWLWDISSDTLVWSPRCKALFGLPSETQMTRERLLERIHPDDSEAAHTAIERALSEAGVYDIEYRVVWSDGTVHWVAAKGRGYQDAMGRPIRFEGTVQDIDERRRAVESQRRFLRDVLASVTEGRLILCQSEAELPAVPPPYSELIPLSMLGGLRDLRQAISAACQSAGLSNERCYDLVTASSEAGMNAAVHAGVGTGQVFVDIRSDMVQVRIMDHGSGISLENLPHATLRKGFTTAGTLGHGMKMMLQAADRVYLLTGSSGTNVVIEQERVAQPPAWL